MRAFKNTALLCLIYIVTLYDCSTQLKTNLVSVTNLKRLGLDEKNNIPLFVMSEKFTLLTKTKKLAMLPLPF